MSIQLAPEIEAGLRAEAAARGMAVCREGTRAAPRPFSRSDRLRFKLKRAEDSVAITLDLKPEVEAELMAQAQAAGLSFTQFLSRELEAIAPVASAQLPTLPDGPDQWEKELDEWLDSFPQHPVLHEEALKRENWYPDRW